MSTTTTTTTSSAHARIPAHGDQSVHVLGDLIRVKVGAEQAGGAFSMFEIIVPPGGGPPLHRHAPCEAFHVLEGTLVIRGADGAETPAAAGDTVFVPANAPHTYSNPGPGNARFLVTLAPGGFEAFFADLGSPAGDATDPEPLTGAPEVAHVLAVTERHGIEILEGPPPTP
jgi:quercetin dioxygenase-like cupin family protein